jgi:TRAP-type C4-dicarboxylate transport system permease small subunit
MKVLFIILAFVFCIVVITPSTKAQCSVCTKTASQLGEKPAKGLNQGILYLMFAPFAIVGVVGYQWWKNNKRFEE